MLGEEKVSKCEVYQIAPNSPNNKRLMIYSFNQPEESSTKSEPKKVNKRKKMKLKHSKAISSKVDIDPMIVRASKTPKR